MTADPDCKIEKVYFINLAMRPDRLEHMQKQLTDCVWPYERIEAIRLDEPPENLGYKLIDRLAGEKHVVSIWLSHKKALEAALNNGGVGAFILLEDDVQIKSHFWSKAFQLPKNLPEDWEILFLTPRYRINPNGPLAKEAGDKKWLHAPLGLDPVLLRKIRSQYICSGAHFCVFKNLSVVKKILDSMACCDEIYDVDLYYLSQFQTYGVHDANVKTAPLGSDHSS